MSNDFSNMRTPGRVDQVRRKTADGPGLYIVFGAAVLVAAIVGGLVVFFALRASQPQVATGNSPVAAQGAPGGNGAGAQPAAPQISWKTTGTFGNWQVQCQETNAKACRAVLQVIRDKQVIMAWFVGTDGKGALQNVLQTPTGVMVSAGIDIKVGSAAARHANFLTCGPQGCTAAVPIDDAFIKDASAAPKTDVVLYAPNGQSVDFGIPTGGLDKAIAALKK
jgi:invasion protein IalB